MKITHRDEDGEEVTFELEAWEEEGTGENYATISLEDEISVVEIELSPKEMKDLVADLQKKLVSFEEDDKARVQTWNALSKRTA